MSIEDLINNVVDRTSRH